MAIFKHRKSSKVISSRVFAADLTGLLTALCRLSDWIRERQKELPVNSSHTLLVTAVFH